MHCKSFWINSFSAAWIDGWVCVACWGTWGPNSGGCCLGHGKEGMAGWRCNHHGVGAGEPLLTSVSCDLVWKVLRETKVHTHTYTHIYSCAQRHSSGLSPDMLNLASGSGTCYWKSCSKFYSFDLAGEKYCKGYQHRRGRPTPYCFPCVPLHLQTEANSWFYK